MVIDIAYRLPLLLRNESIPDEVVRVILKFYSHLLSLDLNDESLERLIRFVVTTAHWGVFKGGGLVCS